MSTHILVFTLLQGSELHVLSSQAALAEELILSGLLFLSTTPSHTPWVSLNNTFPVLIPHQQFSSPETWAETNR